MSVFDASAMLAIAYLEPGHQLARDYLRGGSASLVNVAEAVGDLVLEGGDPEGAMKSVADLALIWVEPDVEQTLRAARMRTIKNLSLGDRFCIALAQSRREAVVTADRAWANLDLGVPVHLIR